MIVRRYGTVWKGEKLVRRHLTMTEELYEQFQAEADEKYGGNLSFLFKDILDKHYKKNAKPYT